MGVILLARHGDRTEYYQDPVNYQSQQPSLTQLGALEVHELGTFLRNTYLEPSSPSYITGISPNIVNPDQLLVKADAGGGNVGMSSAHSLAQGLYPPSKGARYQLGNGAIVSASLGAAQSVPVEPVNQDESPMFTPWIDCPYFQSHLNRTYRSAAFKQLERDATPFLNAAKPFVGGMSTNFTNMWNVYDHMHVQSQNNKAYRKALPPTFLKQARHFANLHQREIFNAQPINAIGEVAIRTLLPEMIWAMTNMTSGASPTKLALTVVDYKPFISLFNVTNATLADPDVAGIPQYASALALELYNKNGQPELSLKFKNGTINKQFRQLKMWGETSVPLTTFIKNLDYRTISNTRDWCFSCNQTITRGCAAMDFTKDPFLHPSGATY
ncbi:phosphoglycerate mutase-like protein [Coniophora puteana RWD-64-598 SS2]|uniref:Phosphoglycerate mutase-like protein n=1 Tax=Coniophora puteana (strain RWD-64-598) TaxID=741705 RepID=A0A5M3MYH6_CONPW|nr:phosphoglycerate mutase-like protein [Coniophora puteana RWD-64-598 SS2]EIW84077.1 phosphoglycerate mutase-like protein [Coniophora puteana RWD-64-598 SS2]